MLTRRSFLNQSAAAVLSVAAFPTIAVAVGKTKQLKNFGFIAGIIGKELKGDWKSILAQTVEYGFSEIETGQYLGESADVFLSYCKKIGLKPIAGGVPFTAGYDELNKKLDALEELGIKYAVNYWPWLSGGPFLLEDCKKSVEILNGMGEICQKRGFIFCWHNHDKEFAEMEQGLPFDYLMEHTDKKLVKCELDVFWVKKGDADPLSILKKYRGRFEILHLKDMTGDDRRTFECVGNGIIDFPSILKEAATQGINHFFVEYDNVQDGMACLKTSGKYLKNLIL